MKKLDCRKITTIKEIALILHNLNIEISEDCEDFDDLKHLLSNNEKETKQYNTTPNIVHQIKITDFIGEKVWFDEGGAGYIWGEEKDGGSQMIGEVRGWGAIQNLFKDKNGGVDFKKAEDFQDALGHWIADAIQQKLKKENED